MCGIVGIVSQHQDANQILFDALTALQHRGQDAAGIATYNQGQLHLEKNNGLVREVFLDEHMKKLKGNIGIGHIRYPTAGTNSENEAQPFYVNSPYGIALAHNGNLNNASLLKQQLFQTDRRHLNTTSDSEILLNVFAHELQKLNPYPLNEMGIFEAIRGVHERCQGAYAVVAMLMGIGLVGFRDPHGIRPIIYGERITEKGKEIMMASESVALQTQGFTIIDDILPGEAVLVTQDGVIHKQQCIKPKSYSPCLFEYVYLARPDSIIDKISVYQTRVELGTRLAEKILREWPEHDIEAVIPVPETSRTSAVPLSKRLGVEYREGFVKNRYIGRTFIMPGQTLRKKSVRQKLNAIDQEFRGKNVLLVDDSIVRGTTSREIIQLAREAGAKKIYFASSAPEIRYPNVYGIDMPAQQELIAYQQSNETIAKKIGADRLFYQSLEDLISATAKQNPHITQFETSVFDGHYPTGQIDAQYLEELANNRGEERSSIALKTD